MTNQLVYESTLRDGSAVECNQLSLCCLNDYYPQLKSKKFQVDCSDYRARFSQLYNNDELPKAVKKYLEIKKRLYG
jgi:hypothetical protein